MNRIPKWINNEIYTDFEDEQQYKNIQKAIRLSWKTLRYFAKGGSLVAMETMEKIEHIGKNEK